MISQPKEIDLSVETIKKRALASGGFVTWEGASFRPDVTAWAVLALKVCGYDGKLIRKAQQKLAACQLPDGRVALAKDHPEAYWPTALAMFTWLDEPDFKDVSLKAANFLLANTGVHSQLPQRPMGGHDISLRGWPWIDGTHSWVVPTSIALLALKAYGYEKHERIIEAAKMLYDRQLPSGGWNYGNTVFLGTELLPIVECTGHALNALNGHVQYRLIQQSIQYLEAEVSNVRTPLSLSWTIFGLGTWGRRPKLSKQWLLESITLQKRYGPYSTDLISLLVLAFYASKGLLSVFQNPG